MAATAVERGAAATGRLLTFARRGEVSATPIAPLSLPENVVQLLRHTNAPAVTLQVEAGPNIPVLFADASPYNDPPHRSGTAMLLVDDEPALRTVLAALLADQGDVVTEAAGAASALAQVDAGLAVDVLVTDLAMPGEDGLALIREARRWRPGLPAVPVTGYPAEATNADIQQAAASGPFALLRKPFSVKMPQARVAALLLG